MKIKCSEDQMNQSLVMRNQMSNKRYICTPHLNPPTFTPGSLTTHSFSSLLSVSNFDLFFGGITHNAAPGFLGGIATRAAPGEPGVDGVWLRTLWRLPPTLALRTATALGISLGFWTNDGLGDSLCCCSCLGCCCCCCSCCCCSWGCCSCCWIGEICTGVIFCWGTTSVTNNTTKTSYTLNIIIQTIIHHSIIEQYTTS